MLHFHTFRRVACAALTIGAIAVAAAAHAQRIPLKGHGQGQLLAHDPQNPFLQEYVGVGVLTLAGRGTFIGSHTIEADGDVVNGVVVITNGDGSTVEGHYSGTWGTVPGNKNLAEFKIHAFWIGGKGTRLAGVIGESEVIAILDTNTGIFVDEQDGFWLLNKK
jgi:hypothetical protein